MGGGSAPKPDTAITLSISKLAALLGVKPALLKDILGTTAVELRDQPKIVAGGIDAESEMGFWTFFNSIGSIPVLNLPREPAIHTIRRKCTNGAVNAGNQSILLEPAANSIVIIFACSIFNLDAVARAALIRLRSPGGSNMFRLAYSAALGAGQPVVFPNHDPNVLLADFAIPTPLTDDLELFMQNAAVDVAEDSDFFIFYSYIGDAPTITETGPAGSAFADVA